MSTPTTYEIVLRGRASARVLRPLVDDFTIDHARPGVTRLVGGITDAAHLHGLLAHLTAVGAEVVSLVPLADAPAGPSPHALLPRPARPSSPGASS